MDRAHLRHTRARDDPRGADAARPDTDLDHIGTGVHQGLHALGRDHVAAHYDHLGPTRLDCAHRIDHTRGVPVGSVDDKHVNSGRNQGLGPLHGVVDPDRRGHPEPSGVVERAVGILDALGDVLHGDQACEDPVVVDQRELLDPVAVQDRHCLFEAGSDRRGDQRLRRHEVGHRFRVLV